MYDKPGILMYVGRMFRTLTLCKGIKVNDNAYNTYIAPQATTAAAAALYVTDRQGLRAKK